MTKETMTLINVSGSNVALLVALSNIAMTFGVQFVYVPCSANEEKDDVIYFTTSKSLLLSYTKDMNKFTTMNKSIIYELCTYIEKNAIEVDGKLSLSYIQTHNII